MGTLTFVVTQSNSAKTDELKRNIHTIQVSLMTQKQLSKSPKNPLQTHKDSIRTH